MLECHKILPVLLKFFQNRPLTSFLLTFKKWSNHFISAKQFQKGNMATLVCGFSAGFVQK
jgi:hypothetical protein